MNEQRQKQALYVILCDARSLIKRIVGRKADYISIFAMKRTRDHFEQIFRSKFDVTTPDLLSHCPEEIINLYYQFHDEVEQLKWYLIYTDDMPNAIDEVITRDIHAIELIYNDFSSKVEEILFANEEGLPPVPDENDDIDELDEEFDDEIDLIDE